MAPGLANTSRSRGRAKVELAAAMRQLLRPSAQGLKVLSAGDAAAQRTLLELGTAAVQPATAFQAAAALLDLIVAQTTAFGTAWLALANAAAARTNLGDGTASTGTGGLVRATSPAIASPTFTTPVLGTPSSGALDNCTGARVTVQKGGGDIGTRHKLNFIAGAGIDIAVTENEEDGSIDITISAA